MKTEKQLNSEILEITMKIQDQFPELSKYIAEMPITIPNASSPEINIKSLQEYYESLVIILKDYAINHGFQTKKYNEINKIFRHLHEQFNCSYYRTWSRTI